MKASFTPGSDILQKAHSFFDVNVAPLITNKFEDHALGFQNVLGYSVEGGKRIRPYSTYLCYKICGGKKSSVVYQAAAAMELMHCSSLVFDDALDKRKIREDRKVLTVRQKYSPEESMLTICLDMLYSLDFLVDLKSDKDELTQRQKEHILSLFVRSVSGGGIGEINKWRYMKERRIPTSKEYWDVFLRSSGGLFFKMSCETGAALASLEKKDVETFSKIGYKLGQLLQAGDDLKDIKLDMLDGFYSLAVINHYNSLKPKERNDFSARLSRPLSPKDSDEIFKAMRTSGALGITSKQIEAEGSKILNLLDGYPDSREKKELTDIISYLSNRMSKQWI